MDFISDVLWRPTISDPTLLGWLTVGAYAIGAALAVIAALAKQEHASEFEKQRRPMWLAVAVLMTGLGINRQLYLHALITEIGRALALHESWYSHRQDFQEWAVLLVLLGTATLAGWLIWRFHAFWFHHRLLVAGVLLLLTLLVVRTISFHPIDVILRTTIAGLRLHRALELAGILLVCLAAVKARARLF